MYIIQEIQTGSEGVPALTPAIIKETRPEAESEFYRLCGYAVISDIPCHTVMTFTHDGFAIPELCKCFIH